MAQAVETVPASKNVQILAYIAAGYDISTPFLILKNAHTVVGIDENPFIKDINKPVIPRASTDHHEAFTQYKHVARAESVAAVLLYRMTTDVSNFRLKRIIVLSEPTFKDRPIYHGVIQFDNGEGTPFKTYIHIHSPLSSNYHNHTTPWWVTKLEEIKINGLLIKGAMETYYPSNLDLNFNSGGPEVVFSLAKRGGLIVDADTSAWKLLSKEPKSFLYRSIKKHEFPIRFFGYSLLGTLQIIEFPPHDNAP